MRLATDFTFDRSTFASLDASDEAELARVRLLSPRTPGTAVMSSGSIRIADGPSFVPMYEEIYGLCHYAFPIPQWPARIIDGGANIGVAARWFAQHYPGATIVSFEPDPSIFDALRANTEALAGVELHRTALGRTSGTATFYLEGSDAGRLVETTDAPGPRIEVPVVSLAETIERLGRVDMLKLDIEGAELEVLEGARDVLDRVEHLYVEFHSIVDRPQRFGEILDLLEAKRFRYRVETRDPMIAPLFGRPADRGVEFTCGVFASRRASDA